MLCCITMYCCLIYIFTFTYLMNVSLFQNAILIRVRLIDNKEDQIQEKTSSQIADVIKHLSHITWFLY